MLTPEKIFNRISKILNSQLFGVIATQGSKYPYTSLVGIANTSNYSELIFATPRNSRKYKNLTKSPHVSILVDTRLNEISDIMEAEALTALGSAIEVPEQQWKDCANVFLSKHPNLKEFIETPQCSLVKITVDKYILVDHFQNVTEIDIK